MIVPCVVVSPVEFQVRQTRCCCIVCWLTADYVQWPLGQVLWNLHPMIHKWSTTASVTCPNITISTQAQHKCDCRTCHVNLYVLLLLLLLLLQGQGQWFGLVTEVTFIINHLSAAIDHKPPRLVDKVNTAETHSYCDNIKVTVITSCCLPEHSSQCLKVNSVRLVLSRSAHRLLLSVQHFHY